jgi:hypothetical protein
MASNNVTGVVSGSVAERAAMQANTSDGRVFVLNMPPFTLSVFDGVGGRVDYGAGGGSIIVPDRRNHSVNGASVEDFSGAFPSPVLRTNTTVNNPGAFNGGGAGNKAIFGHWLAAPLALSAFASMELDYERITPEITGLVSPYLNALVEFDPIGNPGVLSVLVFAEPDNALNTGTFTPLGPPNQFRSVWTPGANYIQIANDKGMGPPSLPPPTPLAGPATVPVTQGPPQPANWNDHDYTVANLLIAYPAARIVNGSSGDGGLPQSTPTAAFMVLLGDSGFTKQNAARILDWRLNGVSI